MPKRSDLYKAVHEHFAKGENQEIADLVERAEAPLSAGVAYYVAAALINLSDYASAREHIEAALETAEGVDKADLTALDAAKQTFTATGLRLLAGRAFDTLFPAEADLPDMQLQVMGEVRALRQGTLTKLR